MEICEDIGQLLSAGKSADESGEEQMIEDSLALGVTRTRDTRRRNDLRLQSSTDSDSRLERMKFWAQRGTHKVSRRSSWGPLSQLRDAFRKLSSMNSAPRSKDVALDFVRVSEATWPWQPIWEYESWHVWIAYPINELAAQCFRRWIVLRSWHRQTQFVFLHFADS